MSHIKSDVSVGDTERVRWSSVSEIAAYLGVSKDTIYTWLSQKRIPAYRVGKLWKFQVSEINEWVRSGGASEKKS